MKRWSIVLANETISGFELGEISERAWRVDCESVNNMRFEGSLSLFSKDWCIISTAVLIAAISASKLEQNVPHASLNSNLELSGNFRYPPNPANVVPLKAELSVYAWILDDEYVSIVSSMFNFRIIGSVLLFTDGSRREVFITAGWRFVKGAKNKHQRAKKKNKIK